MVELTATVIIAQEGRLRLIGDRAAGHRFIASPKAQVDPPRPQLHGQFRVRAAYATSPNLIVLSPDSVDLGTPRGSA
jgi:hypothetical protein